MPEQKCIFDDWTFRNEKAYKSEIRLYKVFIMFLTVMSLFVIVMGFIMIHALILVFVFLPVLMRIIWEWLELRNSHLKIFEDSIQITNRFNKIKVYSVDYTKCTLIVQQALPNPGGIVLRFCSSESDEIIKYIDRMNRPSDFQAPKTEWEKAIIGLGMKIIDKGEVFKNRINK